MTEEKLRRSTTIFNETDFFAPFKNTVGTEIIYLEITSRMQLERGQPCVSDESYDLVSNIDDNKMQMLCLNMS